MLIEKSGNIFNSLSEGIVIPVNTKGILGAGLAKQAKSFFPLPCKIYTDACRKNLLQAGSVFPVENKNAIKAYKILIFTATKSDWRNPSSYEIVEKCAQNINAYLSESNLASIAIPALGCGLGGLEWTEVRKILLQNLTQTDLNTIIYLHEPIQKNQKGGI